VICGGVSSQHRQTQLEEEAAARLEALPGGKSNQIDWQMGRVNQVLFFSPFNPGDFEQAADAMERFSQLHFLQINDALPGRSTAGIGRLTPLRTLCAQNIAVTDEDLAPLANLKNLEYLELDGTQLTDKSLVHLRGLKRLRTLNLYNANQVTPQAMAELRAGLPALDRP
jgi:Leucine-rich repeat (LRR) protein